MMPFNELAPFHLAEIQIERFKAAFKPGPIALRPFTVIIGRNGSGKSTVLEALQWLDTTIRRDARVACERYFGMSDLVNLRGNGPRFFQMNLRWDAEGESSLSYSLRVDDDEGLPSISKERLSQAADVLVETASDGNRRIFPNGNQADPSIEIPDRDRLSLNYASAFQVGMAIRLREFWARAVFLRLSPSRLAHGSSATRKSFEPLLDEEGELLPALLHELSLEQREELAAALRDILPGIQGVELDKSPVAGRDTRRHYKLIEKMPYKGRSGKSYFAIPAWMLSEGTRRITALLALLVRDPPPSFLCVEEVENGLDPWTILSILKVLRSAADRGIQVVLTTHSLWLLDHLELDDILYVDRVDGDTRYQRFRDRKEVQAFQSSISPGGRYYWG